jgi:hypothetical protein
MRRDDALHELEPLDEQPEHQGEWHRFLIYALMAGLTTPQRIVERIVAELEDVA